ncbi:DUF3037 domain-containing protein [Piscinibacter gummiphilus]|uniref:DUF3037 domain-containing protein n=1 Tax=Piscinibacter gummiphilus TaxID=946333 RepID=A0ABZ0CUB6_9BURK|nr:DUF3037 domain-containing protein [Piscinibacter gummiphilus]WOB08566.1 DUF3037 domain-containing protein [Piscinibacter gummiphilus]
MPTLHTYDYAIVRVVPRVERGEFVNVGAIVSCKRANFLKAQIELDEARVLALAPGLDLVPVRATLRAIPDICAGGDAAGALRHLSARERFDWLVAPRSTVIQTSPVHTGRCEDLDLALEKLIARMVRVAPAG